MPYYSSIDGLRGIAILMVLSYHFAEVHFPIYFFPAQPIWDLNPFRLGWIGVDLFFVISGFLITSTLLKTKGSSSYYTYFFARRIIRIFPLYYVLLSFYFFILPNLNFNIATPLKEVAEHQWLFWLYSADFYVLFFGNWPGMALNHLWSLSIEEKSYLILPFVVAKLSVLNLKKVCIVLFFSATLLRFYMFFGTEKGILVNYSFFLTRMDALVAGVYLAVRRTEQLQIDFNLKKIIFLCWVIGLASVLIIERSWLPMSKAMQILVYPLNALLSMVLTETAIASKSSLDAILRTPVLKIFGKYCYSLYLFHSPLFAGLKIMTSKIYNPETTLEYLFVAIVWLSFALFLSHLSWLFFESPILKLKRYFAPSESVFQLSPAASNQPMA